MMPTSRFKTGRLLQVRRVRGGLLCLVRLPAVRHGEPLRLAFVASAHLPHLRRWQVMVGGRPSARLS